MTPLWINLVAILIAATAADDSCPAPEDLYPCTCDGEGLNCMGDRTLDEIKKAFRAKFKYGAVRSVWVQGTPITELPGGIFGNVKSQQFYVEVNNIATVDANAFNASRKSLKVLSLFGNKIKEFPFKGLSIYENLVTLNLGRNLIETIPEGAFNNKNLNTIILAQNRISEIGVNAFKGLPRLGRLEMSFNIIEELGPLSFAFKSHAESFQINLSANKISEVSPSAFNGTNPSAIFFSQNQLRYLKYDAFGDLIVRVARQGGFIEVSSNPFSCEGCDYSWLFLNKYSLTDKFLGFACQDHRTLIDLTKENINCN